jgi:hypothetical protein
VEDRRRNLRERSMFPVQVVLTVPGFERAVVGRVIDSSDTGLGVETYLDLPVGANVTLRAAMNDGEIGLSLDCQAQVCHCLKLGNGLFRAGLALGNVSWSRQSEALTLVEA